MEYDNLRDQFTYGYDRGQILDGTVVLDPDTKEYVIVDIDGIAFSPQAFFKTMAGKQIRFTCASYESIATIEELMKKAQAKQK